MGCGLGEDATNRRYELAIENSAAETGPSCVVHAHCSTPEKSGPHIWSGSKCLHIWKMLAHLVWLKMLTDKRSITVVTSHIHKR